MAGIKLTGRPKTAGILLIVTGSIGLLVTLILALVLWVFSEGLAVGFGSPRNAPPLIILVLGIIAVIPAVFAIIGGFNALKRRRWGLALAGSICACLYFNILGVPGLILLILSKNEFDIERTGLRENG